MSLGKSVREQLVSFFKDALVLCVEDPASAITTNTLNILWDEIDNKLWGELTKLEFPLGDALSDGAARLGIEDPDEFRQAGKQPVGQPVGGPVG